MWIRPSIYREDIRACLLDCILKLIKSKKHLSGLTMAYDYAKIESLDRNCVWKP